MASITVNGVTYTDDSDANTGLANGGHRTRFVPLLSNAVVDLAAKVAAAQSAQAAAAAYVGATLWVSGTTYAVGDVRKSPANANIYTRRTVGAGTTDPSLDATNWAAYSLALAGATFTGDVAIPSINGGQLAGLRNRVINGAMNIDQRNNGAPITVVGTVAALDRFGVANTTGGGTLTVQQSTIAGYGKSLKATATAAITALTTTNHVRPALHAIESQNCFHLNGKTVTLSFIVETNWAGNLAVSVRNSGSTRSYVTNVAVVSGINTKFVVVPLEAATIAANDNSSGLTFDIGFCNEGQYQTATTGSWVAGGFYTSTTSTQWCKTASSFVNFTQIQLEPGAIATPFEQRLFEQDLASSQRYYTRDFIGSAGALYSLTAGVIIAKTPVSMRINPTASLISGTSVNIEVVGVISTSIAAPSFAATNNNYLGIAGTLSATNSAPIGAPIQIASNNIQLTSEFF